MYWKVQALMRIAFVRVLVMVDTVYKGLPERVVDF